MNSIDKEFFREIGNVPPVPSGVFEGITTKRANRLIIKNSIAALIVISLVGVFVINSMNKKIDNDSSIYSQYNDDKFSYIDDFEIDSYSLLNDL